MKAAMVGRRIWIFTTMLFQALSAQTISLQGQCVSKLDAERATNCDRNLSASLQLFPAVLEYEVPAFLADRNSKRNGTDQPYFSTALSTTNAVYSIWIGTNDLG